MRGSPDRQFGFSLVEFITVLAISAVLLGIAVPSFTSFITQARSSSEYQELTRALGVARSEAITRGTDVIVSKIGSNWDDGFRIWIDQDGDSSFDSGEELREFSDFGSKASMAVTGNAASITFTSNGLINVPLGTVITFEYRTNPSKCAYDRNIVLKHTGHVSVEERSCS